MENTVIIVTKPHGITLPPVDSTLPEERNGLMLLPGENDVSVKAWDQAKLNPSVKVQLKAGTIKVKGPGRAVSILEDWEKMPLGKARDMVARIDDVERLRKIKTDSKKKKIGQICDARIDEILADALETGSGDVE